MTLTAVEISHQVLESELEALLTEAELIRAHQPPYNILLKDDKTPLYIHITNETFPRVLTVRKKEMERTNHRGIVLGPFPSAYKVREVLKIAREIFGWCSLGKPSPKACFYYHIGLCPGVCTGEIDAATYQENIKQLVLFLRGQKKTVIKNLQQQMEEYVQNEQFEKAATLRDALKNILSVTGKQYKLRPETVLPSLLTNKAEERLVYLRKIVGTYLPLPKDAPLTRIEGYDVSNIQGTNPSVAMVTFINGESAPNEYKLFNIRSLNTPNDFAMHQEALIRRQGHPEWGIPDLIVIDGGKGQLRAALKVWRWACPVISIAKDPDRIIIPYASHPDIHTNVTKTEESSGRKKKAAYPNQYHELQLPSNHPALQLIQHIRDESHRFSKKQHTRRRTKQMLE
jgi:excinuclease ABC subunit C